MPQPVAAQGIGDPALGLGPRAQPLAERAPLLGRALGRPRRLQPGASRQN
jgi:hypothetical protein